MAITNEKKQTPTFPAYQELPLIKSGERNTKNLVIMVLAGEWPLSVQDICNTIHENYDSKTTYQGIRKAVLQLEAQKILEKNSKNQYKISHKWAESINRFSEDIKVTSASDGGADVINMPPYYSRAYEFKGKAADAYFWGTAQLLKAWMGLKGKKLITCIQPHPIPLTILKKEEYTAFKMISTDGNHFVACPANTPLDRIFLGAYKEMGAKIKCGCKVSKKCDVGVVGDFVMEVYHSKAIRKRIDDLFYKHKKVDEKTLTAIHEILLNTDTNSKVVITNNPEAAKKMREQIIRQTKK